MTITKYKFPLLLSAGMFVAAAEPSIVIAQPADTASEAEPLSLEEIVVTARKSAENLQDTPIAVSAYTGDALARKGVSDLSGIAASTPSLRFDAGAALSGSSNSATVFIRGIGQTDFNLTIDPGVGIYLDGVYISRSVGALLDLTDVERVEVLRGPQGTLFGKNTIGGAVVITSKQPSDALEFGAEATFGSYDRADLRISANLPIGDRLKVRLSGATLNRDGYVKRLSDGGRMGDKNQLTGRIVAALEATDAVTLTATVDGTRAREASIGSTSLAIDETAPLPTFHNVFQNAANCAPNIPGRLTNPTCFNSQWITGDPYKSWASDENRSDSDVWGASLVADIDLGGPMLKSISSYRSLDSFFVLDQDQSPIVVTRASNDYRQEQYSQEFQLTGHAFDRKLRYLIGLYYLKEKGTDRNIITLPIARFRSGGAVENDSYAAFSQLVYRFNDRLSLTLGGRFTHEKKRFLPDQQILSVDPLAQAPLPPGSPLPFFLTNPVTTAAALQTGGAPQPVRAGDRLLPFEQVSTSVNRFTPSLSLDMHVSDDVLLYGSFSRGFKSGGFTQRIFPPEAEAPSFAPETVDAFEFGTKAQLFDRRVRWNSAIFYNDYKDLQLIVADGLAPKVRNAGKARIWGVESEIEALLTEAIRINAAMSYLDAKYLKVDPRAAPVNEGSRLVNTPKWQLSAGATVDFWRGEYRKLSGRVDWSYTSSHSKDAENTSFLKQGGYHLVNGSLTLAETDERWSIGIGVTNLTDEAYLVTGSHSPFIGSTYGVFARPREFYGRVTVRY